MDKKLDTLPEFVFIENNDLKDKTLILQTNKPYLIGHVWRFKTSGELAEFIPSFTKGKKGYNVAACIIEGYNIVVTMVETLPGGGVLPIDYHQYSDVAERMAEFYKLQRIIPNEKYFKRYANN